MSNNSNWKFSDNSDFFASVYSNTPLKTVSIIFCIILSILIGCAGYGIIWYEKFGTDLKRTLINRLLSSLCWNGIAYLILVLPLDVARYFVGPFNTKFCLVILLVKYVLNSHTSLFLLAVAISRYLYIFYLKNPAQFQDPFWQMFVNIWIVSCSILSQFAFVILPGRQPTSFYLCSGQEPEMAVEVKKNFFIAIFIVVSLTVQGAVATRFTIHRIKIASAETLAQSESSFKKEIIADVLMSVFSFILGVIFTLILVQINHLEPAEMNMDKNNFLAYALQFGFPLTLSSLFAIFFYVKNKQMRCSVWEKVQEMFNLNDNNST